MFDWVLNTPLQWPGNSRQIAFSGFEYFTEYKQFWFILGGILNIFHFCKQNSFIQNSTGDDSENVS